MTMKRPIILSLLLLGVLFVANVVIAQDMTVLIDGLRNPRNISFDAEGNLYIAEAGFAGPEITNNDEPFGASSRIIKLAPDGTSSVVVHGLLSSREGQALGAFDVEVTDTSLWILLGESSDFTIPFTHALIELDKTTGRVKTFVDLLSIELEQDPDGNANQQSNPVDLDIAPDGSIYIANAGCNCLMRWTPDTGVEIVGVWAFEDDNPVPTALEFGPDGDLYVGFLTGFPWDPATSRIERWSDGELVQTYSGLTAITGMLVTEDGTIYATEFGIFDMAAGWSAGRVVMVTEEGITPVLEDLNQPFGLAQAPDGSLLVSVNSTGLEEGMIVTIPMS